MKNLKKEVLREAIRLTEEFDFIPSLDEYISENGNADILIAEACEEYQGYDIDKIHEIIVEDYFS